MNHYDQEESGDDNAQQVDGYGRGFYQEKSVLYGLDLIDAKITTLQNTKFTVQLDDKSVLAVNDLHRELLSNQNLALEEYKLEQKELFSQYKKDLKSIAAGQGVWLSSKAWVWAIIAFEVLMLLGGVVVYYCTKAKFT